MNSSSTPWGRLIGIATVGIVALALVGAPAASAEPTTVSTASAVTTASTRSSASAGRSATADAPAPSAAVPSTTISGHVYSGSGTSTPLADIEIDVVDPSSNEAVRQAFSGPDGAYTVEDVEAGSYLVDISDPGGDFTSASSPVTVNGTPIAGIDAHLDPVQRYRISGTIAVPKGTTAPDAFLAELYQQQPDGSWAFIDSYETTRSYSFDAVAGGVYRVRFSAGDGYSTAVSGQFTLTADKSGVSTTLTAVVMRTITGRLQGLPDPTSGTIIAWQNQGGIWTDAADGDIAADGTYTLRVAPGTYRVYFAPDPDDVTHVPQYYAGVSTFADVASVQGATDVVVSSANVTGIDATLGTIPSIRGVVRGTDGAPAARATVTLYAWRDGSWVQDDAAVADDTGAYDFEDLDVGGVYTLGTSVIPDPDDAAATSPDAAGVGGYADGANALPAGPSGPGVVTVSAGVDVHDTVLAPAPAVTGTVVAADGSPVAGATVLVDRVGADGPTPVATLSTGADGTYSTTFRSPQVAYTVRVSKPGLTTTWLGGGTSATGAATLTYRDVAASFPSVTLATAPVGLDDADRPYCDATALPLAPTGSAPTAVDLGFTANLYGRDYTSGLLSSDGTLSFGAASATPPDLAGSPTPVFAPFGAAVATLDATASRSGYVTYGTGTGAHGPEFCAIWHAVSAADGDAATVDSFELVLAARDDRATGDVDVLFHYGDLAWDRDGAVAVGWTAGTGDADERAIVDGSGEPGAFLAGGTNPLAGRALSWQIDNATTGTLLITPGGVSIANPAAPAAPTPGTVLSAASDPWSPAPVALAYQWTRDGSAIPGATEPTYRVAEGDRGTAIGLVVTGTKDGYTPVSRTAASVSVALGVLQPGRAYIEQTDDVHLVLHAQPWGPVPTALAYQWLREGVEIGGATSDAYTITPADAGHTLTVRITGSAPRYATISTESDPIMIDLQEFADVTAPVIKGTATVGSVLSVTRATTTTTGVAWTYQWLRNGRAIPGATHTTYRLTTTDAGAKIRLRETASKTGFRTTNVYSAYTATVLRVFTSWYSPVITGTAKVGGRLSVSMNASGWRPTGASFAYRWYASGVAIKGATKAAYVPSSSMVGKRISVQITATKTGYQTVVARSASTGPIAR